MKYCEEFQKAGEELDVYQQEINARMNKWYRAMHILR